MDQFYVFIDGIDYGRDTQRDVQHHTVTAEILNFSHEQVDHIFTVPNISFDIRSEHTSSNFGVSIYANGWKDVDKGYVSIVFQNINYNFKAFSFSCFICVLDADGNKRFPQSFSYNFKIETLRALNDKDWQFFGIYKYISRKHLLKESSELLPNDILTLNIDIAVVEHKKTPPDFKLLDSAFKLELEDAWSEFKNYLCLDSIVAKHLRFESRYFERLSCSPMKENETRLMSIPDVEYLSFRIIARFVTGVPSICVKSVDKIFDVYAVAEKYDIPMVTANCLLLLRAYRSVNSSVDLVKLADEYFHDCNHLKESMKDLLNRRDEDNEVIRDLKEKHRFREWYCEVSEHGVDTELLFKSKCTSLPAVEEEIPASAFEFYN